MAKEAAQIGAAIGREFSFDVMVSVARRSKEELLTALDQLVDAGLVSRRGAPPRATFQFKHALVQEAAYNVLLRGQRRELHARIAQALEQQFPDDTTAPELLAHHFAEAGIAEAAIENWLKAGRLAIARSATVEAEAQLTRALELLATLPDGPMRSRQELDVQVALGGALISARGYAATETGRTYARARELCAKIGETQQLFPVLFGQAVIYMLRAEHSAALEVSEELLRLAQLQENPEPVLVGHRVVGATCSTLVVSCDPRPPGTDARSVQPGAGPRARVRLGVRRTGDGPVLVVLDAVHLGISRSGLCAQPRSTRGRPGLRAPSDSSVRAGLEWHPMAVASAA